LARAAARAPIRRTGAKASAWGTSTTTARVSVFMRSPESSSIAFRKASRSGVVRAHVPFECSAIDVAYKLNRRSGTLPTLLRIALVFGVGLEFFFVGAREKPLLAVVRKAERVQLPDQPGRAAIDDLALPSSNVPHHADAQANMILPLSLVRRGPKVDSPFGVGREVGKHRTHQKRRIVIHGGAKADPSAEPDVKAAADRQRQSGIGMGVSVMDASILGKPCTGEQQHPSCEGICILHI